MFRDEKNLKDSSNPFGIALKDTSLPLSYTKTDKLITALYMVTDIIDKDEPLRNKLRTLGTGIISDIHSNPTAATNKIAEIMSFLDVASAINIISEMNTNILRKEFIELNKSIRESTDKVEVLNRQINLSEFFREEEPLTPKPNLIKNKYQMLTERRSNSIGVQKGSTLMKALSDRSLMSVRTNYMSDRSLKENFIVLKKQRRLDIQDSIKINGGNATIKDIKDKAQGSLKNCGEKTLQRELVSMVKDGVLNKTGEKRWSRYFLV